MRGSRVDGSRAPGLWGPETRALTAGLVLTITFVASEALAVITVMPVAAHELGGFRLYGWVFSAFMLGSVVGIVGAGAVPAVAYASIGRSLAGPLRARMMAVLSTAWVAPGLAGPAISAEVAQVFGWRWVFLGLLPVVAVAGSIAMPALIRLGPPDSRRAAEHRLTDGIRAAAGAGMVLAGLTLAAGSGALLAGGGLVVAGGAVGFPALRRLVPAGTLTARRGLPATILSRGMLTFAFFGADAYVTLSITAVRHRSPVV